MSEYDDCAEVGFHRLGCLCKRADRNNLKGVCPVVPARDGENEAPPKRNVQMGQYQGLRGEGLIVLDATAYSNITEFENEKDAQGQAARIANMSGCAIVYAPVAIIWSTIADVTIEAPRTLSKMPKKVLPRENKTP